MHKSTKITPVLRKEIFSRWKTAGVSQRQLAKEYHVDKRVIGRIVERGKQGDFDVHSSVNIRFLKKPPAKRTNRSKPPPAKKSVRSPARKTSTKASVSKRTVSKKN
jgi:hypothetical protein